MREERKRKGLKNFISKIPFKMHLKLMHGLLKRRPEH